MTGRRILALPRIAQLAFSTAGILASHKKVSDTTGVVVQVFKSVGFPGIEVRRHCAGAAHKVGLLTKIRRFHGHVVLLAATQVITQWYK